jgi:two-component system sensor histidine kinase MprB
VTFRARVITATICAAAIAVMLACLASYVTTRNSLIHSVDESLTAEKNSFLDNSSPDFRFNSFLVLSTSTTSSPPGLPVDQTIIDVAKGQSPEVYRTVNLSGHYLRELIVPLPAGTLVDCTTGSGECRLPTTAAEVFIADITGQIAQLRSLVRTLLLVAAGGLLLALALGVILARAALRPLEDVTDEIETVAKTNDMGYRLEEGQPDELGRLRRVFNRLLSSVEASQLLQRQLVVDASHELRTPLTSLRTNAQVLSRARELSPEDLRQLTDDMVTQVDELAALVTDLGELARGDRSEGTVEVLRLDECVDECVDTARTYARIKDINVDVDIEESSVLGRHDRLVRAISNLLTNAIKFTPSGGRIFVTSRGGVVSVADSGPGISEQDQAFVFDRFWRSPSARALPGSGLGLSIVAQVVEELGGEVTLDRDTDLGGARFTITLPEA